MTTEEEILHHAAIMFSELGYHGTSMGNIAKACGKNKATLYHYYKSKDLLYEETLKTFLNNFNTLLQVNISKKSLSSEKIRAFIETIIDLDIMSARIIFRLLLDGNIDLPLSIATLVNKRLKSFESIFKEGIVKGEFKMMDPKNIYYTIVGSSFTFLFENSIINQIKLDKNFDNSKKIFLDELTNSVFDRILNEEDIVL